MSAVLQKIQDICVASQGRSQIFLPGSHGHTSGLRHYYESSSQYPQFTVEPGSPDDLAKIMKVLSDDESVRFAVKGGGHATNPGFSSTEGVLISLSRFNAITFNSSTKELSVGAGCLSEEVYKFIRPLKHNIVGGGGSVGIGGWILGGGYSLKTDQLGLGIDNLLKVDIVVPQLDPDDRTKFRHLKGVTSETSKNPDLFWGIKGGGNNFGVVTKFVLKAHEQAGNGMIYGGVLVFDESRVERVKEAIVNFAGNPDRKKEVVIVAAFRFFRDHGIQEYKTTVLAFWDHEKKLTEADPFEAFLSIPHTGVLGNSDYTTIVKAQTELDDPQEARDVLQDIRPFILPHRVNLEEDFTLDEYDGSDEKSDMVPLSFPRPVKDKIKPSSNLRARWGNVMVSHYTKNLVNVIEEEAKAASLLMQKHQGKLVVADVWPFLKSMFDNSTPSAWPRVKGEPNGFAIVYFAWEGEENDKEWIKQLKIAVKHIGKVAIREGCAREGAPVYLNTALNDVTEAQIYRHNLTYLSKLRREYDAADLMKRTGGFRIPRNILVDRSNLVITNADGNVAIGVVSGSDAIVKVVTGSEFAVTEVTNDLLIVENYKVSIGTKDAVEKSNGEIHVETSPTRNHLWRIVPVLVVNNVWRFSIVNQNGSKRWALDGNAVKCVDISDAKFKDSALWQIAVAA